MLLMLFVHSDSARGRRIAAQARRRANAFVATAARAAAVAAMNRDLERREYWLLAHAHLERLVREPDSVYVVERLYVLYFNGIYISARFSRFTS